MLVFLFYDNLTISILQIKKKYTTFNLSITFLFLFRCKRNWDAK